MSNAPPPKEPIQEESGGFKVGQVLEYWSKTQHKWLVAVVQSRKTLEGQFVYELRCKNLLIKGAGIDRIRAANPAAEAAAVHATSMVRAARAQGKQVKKRRKQALQAAAGTGGVEPQALASIRAIATARGRSSSNLAP